MRQLRIALTLDRVLNAPHEERSKSDQDMCARHLLTLEKLEGGRFFQEIMFNLSKAGTEEAFNFASCTMLLKRIPPHVEDFLGELLTDFGNVVQVSVRKKRAGGQDNDTGKEYSEADKAKGKHLSWALVTFADAWSVRRILEVAEASEAPNEGKVGLKGTRYANLQEGEIVWLQCSEVDAASAVKTTGSFGKVWHSAREKAEQNLEAQRSLAAFSNYRPDVIKYLRIRWLQKGYTMWEQGDLSDDCFYFVVAGALDVHKAAEGRRDRDSGNNNKGGGKGGRSAIVAQLLSGSTFGDVAVLADFNVTQGRRTAGISAATDSVVLALKRVDYLHITSEYTAHAVRALRQKPLVRNAMEHLVLKDLFEGCGLYGSSHTSTFSDRIARAATYVHVRKNEVLFKQYDDADTFYIIVNGYVRVVADGEFVGCLGPGSMFGEAGVKGETNNQRKRTATIIGGFIMGADGAPTEEQLAEDRERSRRKRALKLGPNATGRVYEHADLAVVTRADFLKITAGTTEAIKSALGTKGIDRTEEQMELLFDLLRDTEFFKFLRTPAVQKSACRCLQLGEGHNGEVLFEQGQIEESPVFYIVVQGKVQGRVKGHASFQLEAGASFGEIAVIGETEEDRRRTATMKCVSDVVFAIISQANYIEITSGLEAKALASLCMSPSQRKQTEIEVLLRYFEANKFFKMVGFPAMQKQLLKQMTVRPVMRHMLAGQDPGEGGGGGTTGAGDGAGDDDGGGGGGGEDGGGGDGGGAATNDGDMNNESTAEGGPGGLVVDVGDGSGGGGGGGGDGSAGPLSRQFEPTEGSIYFLMRGSLTVLERPPRLPPDGENGGGGADAAAANGGGSTPASASSTKNAATTPGRAAAAAGSEAAEGVGAGGGGGDDHYDHEGEEEEEEEVARYHVGETFCDLGQLPEVPIPGHEQPLVTMDCQSTIYALPPDVESTESSTIIAGPFPKHWGPQDLYRKFKPIGDIAKISWITTGRIAKRRGRWAQLSFVSVASAQQSTREKIFVEDSGDATPGGSRGGNTAGQGGESLTPLVIEIDRRDSGRPGGLDKTTSEFFDQLMLADAVVGQMSLESFNSCCVTYLTNVMDILNSPPRNRTLPQLTTVVDFLAPTEFMQSMQSSMVRRNCARFLSLQVVEKDQRLYKYGDPATAIYIVLRGSCELDSGEANEEPLLMDIGATLQGPSNLPTLERMEAEGPGSYAFTATARGDTPLVLGKISAEDYIRTCSLEAIQKVMDMYFQIGVDYQQNRAKTRRQTAEAEAEASGRGIQGAWRAIRLTDTAEYNSVLRFAGYKQVYLRIGKSLASNGRYSQAELVECLEGDWEQDLEEFGDPEECKKITQELAIQANKLDDFDPNDEEQSELLTREQYTQSLYQLIDEWSGSVESTKLYEQILQLILDNSSDLAPDAEQIAAPASTRRSRAATNAAAARSSTSTADGRVSDNTVDGGYANGENHNGGEGIENGVIAAAIEEAEEQGPAKKQPGDPGYLLLKPLRQVQCCFQQLADMRVFYQKITRADRVQSEVGVKKFQTARNESLDKLKNMKRGASSGLARMTAQLDIAEDATEDEIDAILRKTFESVDEDGSGAISIDEVALLAKKMGREIHGHELDAAMAEMDGDDSGEVSLDEFKTWFKRMQEDGDLLRDVFKSVDVDGSGSLNKWEVETVLLEMGQEVTPEDLNQAMRIMDDDNSGEVNFEEFQQWWNDFQAKQTRERLIKEDPVRKYRFKQFMDAKPTVPEGEDPDAEPELGRHKLAELMRKLGRDVSHVELDWLMVIVDTDHSDTVSFEEFEQCYELLAESDLSLETFFKALVAKQQGGGEGGDKAADDEPDHDHDHDHSDHHEDMISSEVLVSSVERLCTMESVKSKDDPEIAEFLAAHSERGIGIAEFKEWWGKFRLQIKTNPAAAADLLDGTAAAAAAAAEGNDASAIREDFNSDEDAGCALATHQPTNKQTNEPTQQPTRCLSCQ
jgi:CRP-like cAMP-binding protein/Ca2+-binding EF-hand superfamily protein